MVDPVSFPLMRSLPSWRAPWLSNGGHSANVVSGFSDFELHSSRVSENFVVGLG